MESLKGSRHRLNEAYQNSPVIPLTPEDKYVVFSDFHLGGRRSRDDFVQQADLFQKALERWYLPRGFLTVLNGDVEELQRVSYNRIKSRWADLYALFEKVQNQNGLYKILGNHDIELQDYEPWGINKNLQEGIRLTSPEGEIFIFHGHQPGRRDTNPHLRQLTGWVLRYLAHPLGIKNFTRSHSNQRVLKTERAVYNFSREKGMVSIIGHTHRPLFESLSEIDFHQFNIETLIRRYPEASQEEQRTIRKTIEEHKTELSRLYARHRDFGLKGSIYNPMTLPCLFNSGCVMGKRGMTAIEIHGGKIFLVYWFDHRNDKRNYTYERYSEEPLEARSPYHRMVIKQDELAYLFRRIDLLR